MSELLELCALFAVIYLLDCGVVVPRRALGLVRFAGRWRAQRAFSPNSSWSQGALFGNPLPPLSPPFVAESLPLFIGREGVGFEAPGAEGAFIPWNHVGPASVTGLRVEISGQAAALMATRRGASSLGEVLAEVRTLEPAGRLRRLERLLEARFDCRVVRERLATFHREGRGLWVVTNLLWAALLVSLVALVRLPLAAILVPALGLALAGWIAAPVMLERRLRRSAWFRPAWRPEPLKRALAALTPLGAIRSRDVLARELFGDMDPLAVASVLLPRPSFVALARAYLVQLRFSAGRAAPAGERDQAWWRSALRTRVEGLLRSHGVEGDALMAAPPRDREMAAWCPSCLVQYGDGYVGSRCTSPRCDGISLVRFDEEGHSG